MSSKKSVYTVTALTAELKILLEQTYPIVWITGEVTNFASPSSGHFYFTLKDSNAQISAVMFKGQNRKLSFKPENGMEVTGLCRISVYEPRGTYQVIFEHLEPKGTGALQIAFEQLKKRLFDEGIFDEDSKKPIPYLPRKISIVTSPSGAVVHDFINIINRRYPNSYIEIVPVKVQGYNAENEISDALHLVNSRKNSDVIVLARGGGSLEDLAAFNTEIVARAIYASEIPVVSAIGHDTDYTISDFAADLRAPTPSAAAELIVPEKIAVQKQCVTVGKSLFQAMHNHIKNSKAELKALMLRVKDPERSIQDFRLRTDELLARIARASKRNLDKNKDKIKHVTRNLCSHRPVILISNYHALLGRLTDKLLYLYTINIDKQKSELQGISGRLYTVNPMATLERGYSITRILSDKTIVTDPKTLNKGQLIETLLTKGKITSKVEGKITYVKKDL
jgi:exodeoxyribonuclease VII large subunit